MRTKPLSGGQQQQQHMFVVNVMTLISDETLVCPNERQKKFDEGYRRMVKRSPSKRNRIPINRVNPISEDPP